ncbi:acetyltransferase [Lactobacillus ginsenosidimutans] [Lactiplantibacillus mudanjiangensis]|uniref:sugar O-acetyltransferase n=1 Tax=Lactiplantibacillus mudanjiangensis TaxID=1296538 RepID=UPI001014816D|nr:acetyltransferase [Lactobacillus ginsenosidimutans] [Lactiplantibacillus mudanjiangensis]
MDVILKRALAGDEVDFQSPEYQVIPKIANENTKFLIQLNTHYHTDSEITQLMSQITRQKVSPTTAIKPPFNTDFGAHIYLGQHVFINRNAMFVDLGGIYIGDRVLIGPNVTLVSVNHEENPASRRNLHCASVHIGKGAWLGANVTVLPGVTIGENAIIGAGAIVTKDVPANMVVVGTPAKVIRGIKES